MNDLKYKIEDGRVVSRSSHAPIPTDEPVFLFRARDSLSIDALDHYLYVCEASECAIEHLDLVRQDITRFRKWQYDHKDIVRRPGSQKKEKVPVNGRKEG